MINISVTPANRLIKVVLASCFLLLFVALNVTWNSPATGYEASIYSSTPLIFWVSVILSMVAGISLIVLLQLDSSINSGYLSKIGLLLIALCYTIILGLFIIRGYYMWCLGGDPADHIGWIKEILSAGYIPHSLIYPITHIHLSELILITNLDLVFLHKIIPLMFSLLSVVFIYLFVRVISPNRIAPILALIISCTLTYGWYLNLTPNGLSNLYMPLVLLLIFQFLKQKSRSWMVLLTAVILVYPEFHPVPAIFLGIVFLTLWLPGILPDVWSALREKSIGSLSFAKLDFVLVIPFLILLISLIFWASSFALWDVSVQSVYQTISGEGGPSKIADLTNQISYAQGYGYNIVEQFLKQLGGPVILVILSFLSFPKLWRSFSKNRDEKYIFSLYGPLGLVCIMIPALYVFNLIFGPLRLIIYASILATVIVAYSLSCLIQQNSDRNHSIKPRYISISVTILLVSLFFLGFLNLYPSPYNLSQSYQTTQADVLGMGYFFNYRDVSIPISSITVDSGRFANALLTPEEKREQGRIHPLNRNEKVPWHFGYDNFPSLSTSYNEETNLIITQKDKVLYTDYFPDMAQIRFTVRDFNRLSDDPAVSLLYSNGDFDLWSIAG